jgi:hypothetical protein
VDHLLGPSHCRWVRSIGCFGARSGASSFMFACNASRDCWIGIAQLARSGDGEGIDRLACHRVDCWPVFEASHQNCLNQPRWQRSLELESAADIAD